MADAQDRVNIRAELGLALKALRTARGKSPKEAVEVLSTAGLALNLGKLNALETGERVPSWSELLVYLESFHCSLGGFSRLLLRETPRVCEGPPRVWASPRLLGSALRALRERSKTSRSFLARSVPGGRLTAEKIKRWESGELSITLVRLMMLLGALDLELRDLEVELERLTKSLEAYSATKRFNVDDIGSGDE